MKKRCCNTIQITNNFNDFGFNKVRVGAYDLLFQVNIAGGGALAGASVTINGETQVTNALGQTSFEIAPGTYPYTVVLADYTTINSNVVVVGDQTETVNMYVAGILDLYPNAGAAYSLRRLRSAYAGDTVRVRRSSDNAELDIGFVLDTGNYVLDSASLATFCAATDGFIVTWYDQSVVGLDVTQGVAALQPQIVVAGVVNLLNGDPSILWGVSANKKLVSVGNFACATSFSAACVFSTVKRLGQYTKLFSIGTDLIGSGYFYTTLTSGAAQDWLAEDTTFGGKGFGTGANPRIVTLGRKLTDNIQYVTFGVLSSANAKLFINATETTYRIQAVGNSDAVAQSLIIGNATSNVNQLVGNSQEIILYPSDQNVNQLSIRTNQNTFYGAY